MLVPVVVVETRPFQRFAAKVWSDVEREEFIDYIARMPEAGAIMEGTGGIRKVRWRREGVGKSGGVRVIYYFHDEGAPLFLLTLYPKGRKENLTMEERKMFKEAVDRIKLQIRQSRLGGRK